MPDLSFAVSHKTAAQAPQGNLQTERAVKDVKRAVSGREGVERTQGAQGRSQAWGAGPWRGGEQRFPKEGGAWLTQVAPNREGGWRGPEEYAGVQATFSTFFLGFCIFWICSNRHAFIL